MMFSENCAVSGMCVYKLNSVGVRHAPWGTPLCSFNFSSVYVSSFTHAVLSEIKFDSI